MSKSISLINLHSINTRLQATWQSADPGITFEKWPATSGLLKTFSIHVNLQSTVRFCGLYIMNVRSQQRYCTI